MSCSDSGRRFWLPTGCWLLAGLCANIDGTFTTAFPCSTRRKHSSTNCLEFSVSMGNRLKQLWERRCRCKRSRKAKKKASDDEVKTENELWQEYYGPYLHFLPFLELCSRLEANPAQVRWNANDWNCNMMEPSTGTDPRIGQKKAGAQRQERSADPPKADSLGLEVL